MKTAISARILFSKEDFMRTINSNSCVALYKALNLQFDFDFYIVMDKATLSPVSVHLSRNEFEPLKPEYTVLEVEYPENGNLQQAIITSAKNAKLIA